MSGLLSVITRSDSPGETPELVAYFDSVSEAGRRMSRSDEARPGQSGQRQTSSYSALSISQIAGLGSWFTRIPLKEI